MSIDFSWWRVWTSGWWWIWCFLHGSWRSQDFLPYFLQDLFQADKFWQICQILVWKHVWDKRTLWISKRNKGPSGKQYTFLILCTGWSKIKKNCNFGLGKNTPCTSLIFHKLLIVNHIYLNKCPYWLSTKVHYKRDKASPTFDIIWLHKFMHGAWTTM